MERSLVALGRFAFLGVAVLLCSGAGGQVYRRPPTAGEIVGQVGQPAPLKPGTDPVSVPIWKVAGQAHGQPAADAATAYFLTAQHGVIAVNAVTGMTRWTSQTSEPGDSTFGSTVVLSGDVVAAGDYDVISFDRLSGTQKWRFSPTDGGFAVGTYLGTARNGRIYTGSGGNRMYAVADGNGGQVWSTTTAGSGQITVFEPSADDDIVAATYTNFGSPDTGGVLAVDANSGRVRWQTPFPRPNPVFPTNAGSKTVIFEDLIIAASGDGNVYAFDRSTGTVRWSLPALSGLPAGSVVSPDHDYRPLAMSGRTLLVGSLAGIVVAYSVDARTERWRFDTNVSTSGSIAFRISADDRDVYVPCLGGVLQAIDVGTGQLRWKTGSMTQGFTWPVLATDPGRLYVGGSSAGFFALRR